MNLSKKRAEEVFPLVEQEEVPVPDSTLDRGIEKLENIVKDLGYVDFDFEFIETPFDTNRGKLLAKGTFQGPSPFGHDSRAPEDVSEFFFNILFDAKLDATYIEVKHESALLATYQIGESGIELINGEIPHV